MKVRSLKINAVLNLVKQGCSILFPLITFPYVSRVLGNEGFGQYNFSFTVADYFIIFAALGISTYAIREGAKYRDQENVTQIFCCEVFTINVVATIISALVLGGILLAANSLNNYRLIIIIISAQMVLATIGADWINSIYEDYIYITVRYIVIQVISLALIFILVRSSDDVVKYAIITTFASAGGNLLNIWYVRRYVKLHLVFNKNVFRHLKPVLILFANTLAISIYVNADITMLKFYESDSVVGIYSLSSRIYNIAKRMISAVIIVTTARLAFYSKNDMGAYRSVSRKTFNSLLVILLPCVAGMIMMSKPIVRLVGGTEYTDAWMPLCILSIAMIFALLSAFYSNCVLIIFDCDKALLTATLISAVVNVGLNLFMLPLYGMYGAAITTLAAEALNLGIQYIFARKYVTEKLLSVDDLIKTIAGTFLIVIICALITLCFGNTIKALIIAVPVSCIAYFGLNYMLKNRYVTSLVSIKSRRKK